MKTKIPIYLVSIMGVFLMLSSSCKKKDDNNNPGATAGKVNDIDGNGYDTVIIGTQVWMAENLKTTRYNDGTPIPDVTDNTVWKNLTTPGFCWYKNDPASYKNPYGALYNWYAVNTGKLAPKGWHVPSDTEWTTLITHLGGDSIAGGKMKETGIAHWFSPNTGATNSSGFTALPCGWRWYDGSFSTYAGGNAYYWTSTEGFSDLAWYRVLFFIDPSVYHDALNKTDGFSVRCIKD